MAPRSRPERRTRDAESTQKRILSAAQKEFASNGLDGARVDAIAERADANKRMIYHYFSSKEKLFQRVLEDAYVEIRTAEQKLNLNDFDPPQALEKLVRFTWEYYLKHPEFLALVNSENFHQARHLKQSEVVQAVSTRFVRMVGDLLARGVRTGDFRGGVDPVQLNITIAAIGYYYLTNRDTGAIVFDRDLMSRQALRERLDFNIETIMRLVAR